MDLSHIIGDHINIERYLMETYKHILNYELGVNKIEWRNSRPILRDIAKHINGNYSDHSLVITGNTGTGKSVIMDAVVRVYNAMYGYTGRLGAKEMISSVTNKEGFIQSGMHLSNNLSIDDIGLEEEFYMEFGQKIKPFEIIIHERYDAVKNGTLFLTTNLPPSMLKDRYGDRVFSRIYESSKFIKLEGEDNRLK